MPWTVKVTADFKTWLAALRASDRQSWRQVNAAIDALAAAGPGLGRPLVDTVKGSQLRNLKELRPGSSGRSEVRILFIFDPWREILLLVGGDKAGNWNRWYRDAIKRAEDLYADYIEARNQTDHKDTNK